MTEYLERFAVGTSPLTGKIYIGRLTKDRTLWTSKRDVTNEVMGAITDHMMLNAPKGASKKYGINGVWFEMTVKPIAAPEAEQPQTGTVAS